MKSFYKDFWFRYSFLMVCVGLIVVAAVTIARHTANRQAGDPKLIILAARENMLAERIAQLAGLLEQPNQTPEFTVAYTDTLQKNLERLHELHSVLLKGGQTGYTSTYTQLKTIDTLMRQACKAGEVLSHPGSVLQQMALHDIGSINRSLERHTRELQADYRHHAESNIDELNGVIAGIGIAFFLALTGSLVSFVYPFIKKLKTFRLIQEKLRNSEKLYRLLSTNSQDLISLYNNTGDEPIWIYVSPSIKAVLGYDPEDVLLRTPFEFIHPDDADLVRKEIESATRKGKIAYVEYRKRKKNGTYIWMESSAQPFYNDDGQQIGFQTSARDITQRKEVESRLKEAKENAEEATRAKSQFLSMMSHEIRTPLNGVIGLTNFLIDEKPREDQLKHLKLLKFSGESLLSIINEILDFNKIEAGKIMLEHIPFELKDFLDNVLETLMPRATDKGVPLILKYDDSLPITIKGDPLRLSQVLNNLVGNAIKFTNTGFVHVSIAVLEKTGNNHRVQFTVQDTGIGIHRDKLKAIFEPFTQASADTTRKFGGTGLGLAITKKLLELMGGDIHAKSEPGKGSTFYFTLDFEEAEATQEDKPAKRSIDYARVSHAHLLLVEDNDVNQIVATNYLSKWGFQVTMAANGKEAVGMIRQKAYHLVLMDLQMPELNGYDATQLIREMPGAYFQEVPIIALTASAMTEDITRLETIGFNDYITKPFQPHDLEEKIFKYMLSTVPEPQIEAPTTQTILDAFWGVDPQTNVDLARRIVKNIVSLQQALDTALQDNDMEVFNRACHKMKTTIGILKDKAFAMDMEELRKAIRLKAELAGQLQNKIDRFADGCDHKISELNRFIEETSV